MYNLCRKFIATCKEKLALHMISTGFSKLFSLHEQSERLLFVLLLSASVLVNHRDSVCYCHGNLQLILYNLSFLTYYTVCHVLFQTRNFKKSGKRNISRSISPNMKSCSDPVFKWVRFWFLDTYPKCSFWF